MGLLAIRRGLGLYANLRPVRGYAELLASSPLKPDRVEGVDLLVVRELTGGLYFGKKYREDTPQGVRVVDTLEYHEFEIERIVRLACDIARGRKKKVTSVDKANVLESSRLWRETAVRVAGAYADLTLEHQLVDSCAMRLVTAPKSFDVIVTENMFGDILSDEAAVLTGSLGMLPSASLGEGKLGLYEPIHGSAPDIAGKGIANPLGTILSGALLLRHSLGLENEARSIEKAVETALSPPVTPQTRPSGGGAGGPTRSWRSAAARRPGARGGFPLFQAGRAPARYPAPRPPTAASRDSSPGGPGRGPQSGLERR
jgi:3-isopropylmalate dehydrogenase